MRRTLTAIVVAIACTIGPNLPAEAHHRPGPCSIHWMRAWKEHRDVEPIKRLIRCAAGRWSVPGGAPKALDVARCESGFRPNADGGSSEGLYQHINRYWPGRYDAWGSAPRWKLYPTIWNARTQAIVTMRWVHSMWSWSPWACA